MRFVIAVLFGLMSVLPVVAQDIFGVKTNQVSGDGTQIDLPTASQSSTAQPVHILRDDSGDAEPSDADKNKASFLTSTAVEYMGEGEYEDAERAYLRALEMDPENEEAMTRLASLYVEMERYQDAVAIFKKQIVLNPENPLAHNNLAWCYAVGPEVRNVSLALGHGREALLYAPKFPSVWNTLAEAYYVAGKYDRALRAGEHALVLLQGAENAPEGAEQEFAAQIQKIKRAQEAAEMLMGQ